MMSCDKKKLFYRSHDLFKDTIIPIIWIIFWLSFISYVISSSAYAEDLKRIHIVFVKGGEAGITESQLFQILSKSEEKLNEIGAYTGEVSVIGERWGNFNAILTRSVRLYKLSQYAERKRFRRDFDAVHFVVSPARLEPSWYIAGLARGVCTVGTRRAYSLSNATVRNNTKQYSLEMSATAIQHEIGHTFCARHIDTPTIMNPDANSFVAQGGWPLQWDEQSKKEIYDNR